MIIPVVGITMWFAGGVLAALLARIVPLGRNPRWKSELVAATVTALALGVLATWLDFGGWREPDWRAGAFVFTGAFAAIGLFRLTIGPSPGGHP